MVKEVEKSRECLIYLLTEAEVITNGFKFNAFHFYGKF